MLERVTRGIQRYCTTITHTLHSRSCNYLSPDNATPPKIVLSSFVLPLSTILQSRRWTGVGKLANQHLSSGPTSSPHALQIRDTGLHVTSVGIPLLSTELLQADRGKRIDDPHQKQFSAHDTPQSSINVMYNAVLWSYR
jgi:hypothetical protein